MTTTSLLRIICGAASVIALDQWTKAFFTAGRNISVVAPFITLETSRNTGIAFSIPITGILLIVITILILAGFMWFAWRHLRTNMFLSQSVIALIVGGGIGNLIDRVWHGSVVDFIRIGMFPVFNIADIAVVVGGLCLFLWYDTMQE